MSIECFIAKKGVHIYRSADEDKCFKHQCAEADLDIFALLDPDTNSEYGSGATALIESGSNTDPDPKPCL